LKLKDVKLCLQNEQTNLKGDKMCEFEQAIQDLTVAVKIFTRYESFKVADTTTDKFSEFMEEVEKDDGNITVTLQGNDNTIYGDKLVNLLARVWHDRIHYRYKLDFSLASEIAVAEIQKKDAISYLLPIVGKKRAENAGRLIYLDIVAQGTYYYKHKEFVEHQKSFIMNIWYNKSEYIGF